MRPENISSPDAAPTTSSVITTVIVDDHDMFRAGVCSSLDSRFQVLAQAADVPSAIREIHRTKPQVVLLDVHLPGGAGGGGGEVVAACADLPEVKFLALSVSDAAADVVRVIRAGARGYVTKSITGPDLCDSVARVAEGDAVFSPRLAGFVLDAFSSAPQGNLAAQQTASGQGETPAEEMDLLSARETEVMRLIARGYTYKEVAKELFISVKTVETHVSAVLRKLQLSSRHELTRWALDRRIV